MGQSHSAINDGEIDHLQGESGATLHSGSQARAKRSKGFFQEQRQSLAGPVRNGARRRYEYQPPSPPSPPLAGNQHTPEQSRELLEQILSTSLMPPQQGDTQEYSRVNDAMMEGQSVDGDSHDLPAVLISAPGQHQQVLTTFSDNRVSVVPAQETILEEPESEAPDSVRPGLLALPVLLPCPRDARKGSAVPEHLADTSNITSDGQQQHLTVDASLAGDESISHQSTGSFQVRNSNEESDRQALLAYWQQAGDTILQRRHSWASTPMEATHASQRKEQSYPSPYRSVPGRWTSSLDGRKGLLLEFSDGPKEAIEDGVRPDKSSEMNASEISSAGAKMRRKPVPSWDSAEEKEEHKMEEETRGNSTPPPHLAAPKQYLLWPAKVEEEEQPVTESSNKHNSHVSRASATTDALHSHVEALREGPRFVVDPSASGLMISTDSSASGLGLGMRKAEPGSDSPAVGESLHTRPRKISLMARLKERVRRSSEATATSSPAASSPSKPPKVPSIPHTVMTPAMRLAADHKSRSGIDGGMPAMYPSGMRRNRKSALDASEAVIAARAARRRSQRSVHSVSSRSTRPSARSVRARPSFGSTSRHTIRQQPNSSEGAKGKTRSHSQPVPHQQHWWRHPLWPKKNRGASSAAVQGEEWRDEDQNEDGSYRPSNTARLGNESQPSLTGTELLAREHEEAIPVAALAANTSRDSPPLAYINSDNLLTPDPNDYHAFGYCSSSSDFSSLVRAKFPVPVPPPRPSRRGSKRSVSNGRDSSSSPSPRLPEGEKRSGKEESAQPATSKLISPSNKRTAMLPSLPAIGAVSPRSSKQISDAGTAELLLTDDASGGEAKQVVPPLQDRLEGDEADHIAIMHPIRMLRKQELAASQEREAEEGPAEKEKKDHHAGQEEDGGGESRARRDSSQRGASMGIAADTSGEGASGPAKRPMPAPPILAEPMTDLHSVVRTNSASSVHTASTFGGRRRLVSMVRYSGDEIGSGSLARRSLPPTPNLSVKMLPGRSPVQVQRALPSLLSSYETALTGDLPAKPHSPTASTTMGRRSGSHLVRESWTSADGPWDARLVAVSPDVKKLSPARGFAKPTRQDATQTRQGAASTSDVLLEAELAGEAESETAPGSETRDVDRVPFAETAVQASLAALQALEQSEQGDDMRSRSARERLMGSSNLSSTLAPSIMRMEPSMSEMSSYSRSRRRAVPYPITEKDGFQSSSAEERVRRKPSSSSRAKRLARRGMSSSASQTEGQSVALVFTSDSERARNGHGHIGAPQSGSQRGMGGKKKKSTKTAPPLPKKEDWDEKVVPALARRLRVEAEQEAEMVSSLPRRSLTATSMQRQESGAVDPVISHDVPPQSQLKGASRKRAPEVRARQASQHEVATSEDEADQRVKLGRSKQPKRGEDRVKSERKPQTASISSQSKRTPKIRKGYGCDDIKAWQASLGVASAPIATLVE